MCGQRTSQFLKCEGNRRGKFRKLLDWRREWCVLSTLSHADFIDKADITYLPKWMLVKNSSKLNIRRSTECTSRDAPTRYEQSTTGQGPRASLTILSHQIWHTTGGKKTTLEQQNKSSQVLSLHHGCWNCSPPRLERQQGCNSPENS